MHGSRWAPLLLLGLALFLRLPSVFRPQDLQFQEAYPLKIAVRMWGLVGSPVDLNPHFFHYPSFVIYLYFAVLGLLRLLSLLTGVAPSLEAWRALLSSHPDVFYRIGESVAVCMGSLLVLPAYSLGNRTGTRYAGLLSGLLVAASPALILQSQTISVDTPLTLLTCLALAAATMIATSTGVARWGTVTGAGAIVGLAASAKYPGLFAFAPVVFAVWSNDHRSLRDRVARVAWVVAVAALAFCLTSPFLLLDSGGASRDLLAERAHLRLGHFGSENGAAWLYYLKAWFGSSLGPVVGVLGLIGLLAYSTIRRARWATVCSLFVFPYVVCLSLWALKADRYLLPVLPVAIVAGSTLLLDLSQRISGRKLGPLTVGALFALCTVSNFGNWTAMTRRAGVDSRTVAAEWIQQHVPPGSMLIVEPYGPKVPSPLESRIPSLLPSPVQAGEARDVRSYYWSVPIPMFQVEPERSAVYYDPRLYEAADYWIVSGAVRERYRAAPDRFPVQNAFYNWLDGHWAAATTIRVSTGAGSDLVIYRNPGQSRPFNERVVAPPTPSALMISARGADGESAFYYALGLNYFGFHRFEEAAQCFAIAGRFPIASGGVTRDDIA